MLNVSRISYWIYISMADLHHVISRSCPVHDVRDIMSRLKAKNQRLFETSMKGQRREQGGNISEG